eukprot:Pgem_evm1s1019
MSYIFNVDSNMGYNDNHSWNESNIYTKGNKDDSAFSELNFLFSSSAKKEESDDDDDEDALEAFMTGINKEVKEIKKKDKKKAEKNTKAKGPKGKKGKKFDILYNDQDAVEYSSEDEEVFC